VEKLGLNNPEKIWGGPGQDLGGLCPPGPNVEPPLRNKYVYATECLFHCVNTVRMTSVGELAASHAHGVTKDFSQ